ncbi:MAG: hypothetical protein ABR572_08235 [Cryomorphaceae bacterium]
MKTIISKYIGAFVITAFLLVYLHRRADFFSSAWLIIGAFVLHLPILVLLIRDMVGKKIQIAEGLVTIYAVSLFLTAAIFFIFGKEYFDRGSEIFAAISLLLLGAALWLQRKRAKATPKTSNFEILSKTIPPLLAVAMLVVLNFR